LVWTALLVVSGCGQATGRGGDMGSDAAPPPAPLGDHGGQVTVGSQRMPQTLSALTAGFWNQRAVSCTYSTMGSCGISSCTMKTVPPPSPTAGTVSTSGTLVPLSTMPDSFGVYASSTQTDPAWNGGESITIGATGADVPAFMATLAAPTSVTVTQPAAIGSTIDRAADFTLSWTGASAGVVVVSVNAGSVSVECRFAPAAQHGVVPSMVLQQLPAGMATVGLSTATTTRLTAGSSTVDVALRSLAIGSDGKLIGGNVTLQ
jgi:hypothetical protein